MYLEYDKNMMLGVSKPYPYLDNLLGITTYDDISKFEYQTTADKYMEIKTKNLFKDTPMNFETLCAIHKYLLGDIYPWAGTIREVELYKDDSEFCGVQYLQNGINQYFKELKKDNYLKNYGKEDFCQLLAYYTNELNFLHPFREGNCRSKRIFLSELANQAGWEIDFSKIEPNKLLMCEILAFGNIEGAISPNSKPLKKLYMECVNPTIEKAIELSKPKNESKIEVFNNFLWVYDREECHQWRRSNVSKENAELCINGMLQSNDGKEHLYSTLSRITKNSFDEKVVETAKNYQQSLDDLVSVPNYKM